MVRFMEGQQLWGPGGCKCRVDFSSECGFTICRMQRSKFAPTTTQKVVQLVGFVGKIDLDVSHSLYRCCSRRCYLRYQPQHATQRCRLHNAYTRQRFINKVTRYVSKQIASSNRSEIRLLLLFRHRYLSINGEDQIASLVRQVHEATRGENLSPQQQIAKLQEIAKATASQLVAAAASGDGSAISSSSQTRASSHADYSTSDATSTDQQPPSSRWQSGSGGGSSEAGAADDDLSYYFAPKTPINLDERPGSNSHHHDHDDTTDQHRGWGNDSPARDTEAPEETDDFGWGMLDDDEADADWAAHGHAEVMPSYERRRLERLAKREKYAHPRHEE